MRLPSTLLPFDMDPYQTYQTYCAEGLSQLDGGDCGHASIGTRVTPPRFSEWTTVEECQERDLPILAPTLGRPASPSPAAVVSSTPRETVVPSTPRETVVPSTPGEDSSALIIDVSGCPDSNSVDGSNVCVGDEGGGAEEVLEVDIKQQAGNDSALDQRQRLEAKSVKQLKKLASLLKVNLKSNTLKTDIITKILQCDESQVVAFGD
jgi:hypothetical protein